MSDELDTSRRNFLKASAGVVAAGAIPTTASAQGIGTELNRLQGSRRILLKGGVVLTMDRQLGDFATAARLLDFSFPADYTPAATLIRQLTLEQNSTLREVT